MKGCVLVGCGVVLLVVAAGIALVLFGGRMTSVQDTRAALHHPAQTVGGYEDVAKAALARLESDTAGPRARHLAVEAAHVRRSVTGTTLDVHAEPFPAEIAALEADLWTQLARDVDLASLDVLRRGEFQYDVFPLGRDTYDLRFEDAGGTQSFSVRRPTGMTQTTSTASLQLDPELERILGR